MTLSLILVTTSQKQDVAVRDVKTFFSRFSDDAENTVEILTDRTSPRKQASLIQHFALHSTGDIVFVLDPWLATPLAEVIMWLSFLSENAGVQWLFGDRLQTGFVLNPRAQEITQFNRELLGAKALPDPLCPFFAFRGSARPVWQEPVHSTKLLTQQLSLRAEHAAIQPARSSKQEEISLWEAIKLRGQIHHLSQSLSSQLK